MTLSEYQAALDALDERAFEGYRADFGGDFRTRREYVDDFVHHPEHERRICQLLGLITEPQKLIDAALDRKGLADTLVKSPKAKSRQPRGLIDRYRRRSISNKLAIWTLIVSVVSLAAYLLPGSSNIQQSATIQGSGATIIQPGGDVVINHLTSSAAPRRVLLPQQQRLLELVAQYQKQFAASRLIVSRSDGMLHFDDDPKRGEGVSLGKDLFGQVTSHNAGRFEELVQSIPPEYLKLINEARWDDPFVLSLTEAGAEYLAR